jgi:hypothetical protein
VLYQAVLLSLSAVAVSVPSVTSGTIQSYDSYKAWLVACDNTLTCEAKGLAPDEMRAELRIDRQAGAEGKMSAALSADIKFAPDDVRVDGMSAGLDPREWKRDDNDDGTTLSTDNPEAVRSLAAHLRNGARLSFGGKVDIPLNGFAAAMLRMDDRQGRLGGTTALAKPGPAQASLVPAAPPLPHIPPHPVTAKLASGEAEHLIEAVREGQQDAFAKAGCETRTSPLTADVYALDDSRALVLIPCVMGAYQGSSLAFVAPRGGGPARQVIAFAPYLSNDPDRVDAETFTEADFDPATGTLSMAAKGRGLADCGMSASWIWNGDSFQLSALSLQQACGGVFPGDWPTLFRSTQ